MFLFKIIFFFTNVSKNTLILGSSPIELKARVGIGWGRREKKKYRLWGRSRVQIPAVYLPPMWFQVGYLTSLSLSVCIFHMGGGSCCEDQKKGCGKTSEHHGYSRGRAW